MQMAETDLLDKRQRLLPLLIGLARKADDDVRGQVDVGYPATGLFGQASELVILATPGHTPQYGIRAALDRQMEMGHEAGILEQIPEVFRQIPGFHRPKPQARMAVCSSTARIS